MPENARVPLGYGVLAVLVSLPFSVGGGIGIALGLVLQVLGAVLVAVGVVAWGVWLAIDQWERDRAEGRRSRIRLALEDEA